MTTAGTQSSHWDAADYLTTEEAIVACIEAAFEERDARLIAAALGDVARAGRKIAWRSWAPLP